MSRKAKRLNRHRHDNGMGGDYNAVGATKWAVRPSVAYSFAMTHIRDNDTSFRFAPKTIETGGVPAVCVAFERTSYGNVGL
ncbi:MAG: hypothetical protein ACERKN_15570 [Velocimicrobium sp.]